MAGISAGRLLANKGDDSDALVEQATGQGMSVVIPPRKNRKEQRSYDKNLYRHTLSSRTRFCISSTGRASLRATLTPHHSWPPPTYAALYSGSLSRDDTI
jgi:hypothetical protein